LAVLSRLSFCPSFSFYFSLDQDQILHQSQKLGTNHGFELFSNIGPGFTFDFLCYNRL
jgi:hypothetical protein